MTKRTASFCKVLATLVLATPALAAESYVPPQGCTEVATVQLASCQLEHLLTCADLPQGWQRTIVVDGNGPFYDAIIDEETRWQQSTDLETGVVDKLGAHAEDAASFSTLLEKGRDDFDFTMTDSEGVTRRFIGYDELTGGSTTIGSVTLKNTRFKLEAFLEDGRRIFRREGEQFVWPEQGRFLAGIETFENAEGQSAQSDDRPKQISLPGEKGFGALKPDYGCNAMMTELGSTQG